MASYSFARPIAPLGVIALLTEAWFAAKSDLGGYIAVTGYTPTPFRITRIVSSRYTMERPRRKYEKPQVKEACLFWSGFILWVLNIPLYCSPLSKILPLSRASRFRWMENKTARTWDKTQSILRNEY
jgi:hypothetical protein